jgi:hypothetical protein
MNYWTPIINGKIQALNSYIHVFETKKACQEYIDRTFPEAIQSFGGIKPGKIEISNL